MVFRKRRTVQNIRRIRRGTAPLGRDLCGKPLSRLEIAVQDDDLRSLLGKMADHGRSQNPRRARDDDDAVSDTEEISHIRCFLNFPITERSFPPAAPDHPENKAAFAGDPHPVPRLKPRGGK